MTAACALSQMERFRARPATRRSTVADTTILWKEGAAVAGLLCLLMTGRFAGAAVLGVLILWAGMGTRNALQSLSVSVLVVMDNRDLTGEQPLVGVLKWLLLAIAMGRVLADHNHRPAGRPAWALWFGLFFFAALGLIFVEERSPVLSLMKLGTFSAGALTALVGMRDRRYPTRYWLNWMMTLGGVVLALSAPLVADSVGYLTNTTWFRGILTHSQTFGVYLAPLAVYLTVEAFLRPRLSTFVLAVLAAGGIYFAAARTAFVAVGAGLACALMSLLLFRQRKRRASGRRHLVPLLCTGMAVLLGVAALGGPFLREILVDYVTKGQWDLSAPILSSRGLGGSRVDQVNQLMNSIADYPLFGVGFGLAPAGVAQTLERDELTGLPTGSPSEQGFLPLAVLVQLGVVGAIALAGFLVVLAYPIVKCGDPAILALFWTAVLVNFGEMVFFAIGGLGMQMWLLVALCYQASVAARPKTACS